MVDGSMDAGLELIREDVLMSFLYPFARKAAEEFPAALASIRAQLPVDDGPIGVLGGSLGGAVALRILADTEIPVFAGAVVNAAIRVRSVVDLFPGDYPYDAESEKAADSMDFVERPAPSPVERRCWSSAASWITRRYGPTRSTSSTH
jgi:pimeloyl-ACP methyl ester carboxylesterase